MAMKTDVDILLAEFGAVKDFVKEHHEAGIAPLKEEQERLAVSMEAVETVLHELRRDKVARQSDEGTIRVQSGQFAGFDLLDLGFLETIMEGRISAKQRVDASAEMLRQIQEKRAEMKAWFTPENLLAWEDGSIRNFKTMFPHAGADNFSQFRQSLSGWRSGMMTMLQKALDSTTAGSGDELVPTFQAAQLWMDVNLETLILPLIPQVSMPTQPFDIPIQLGDTNWYPISENVQVTTTDPATQKVTLDAKGLKTGVPFSDELNEDAIIALVPELRRSLVRNAAEVIDDVLLNADTTTTDNINADGATISSSDAGKAQWLLGFDGLIHLPLIDNSATQLVDKSAAVDADIYNRVLSTIGKYAIPRRRGEVVFVTDVNTAIRSLSITELETLDVAGARATMSTGEIMSIYGKPLIMSEQMKLAEDGDGKVTDGGNTSDTGRILCFNNTQWRVGFRRQITMESDREAGKGQTTMYVSFRIALTERSGTRSSATHSSLAFDITGVTG